MVVITVIVVRIHLAGETITGEAVSKFPGESDQSGKRREGAISGTCPIRKQLISSL